MIESIRIVEMMIVVAGVAAITAAIIRIIAIRQNKGTNEANGAAGDKITTAVVTHINCVGEFGCVHSVTVERQQASTGGVHIVLDSRGDNCGRYRVGNAVSGHGGFFRTSLTGPARARWISGKNV